MEIGDDTKNSILDFLKSSAKYHKEASADNLILPYAEILACFYARHKMYLDAGKIRSGIALSNNFSIKLTERAALLKMALVDYKNANAPSECQYIQEALCRVSFQDRIITSLKLQDKLPVIEFKDSNFVDRAVLVEQLSIKVYEVDYLFNGIIFSYQLFILGLEIIEFYLHSPLRIMFLDCVFGGNFNLLSSFIITAWSYIFSIQKDHNTLSQLLIEYSEKIHKGSITFPIENIVKLVIEYCLKHCKVDDNWPFSLFHSLNISRSVLVDVLLKYININFFSDSLVSQKKINNVLLRTIISMLYLDDANNYEFKDQEMIKKVIKIVESNKYFLDDNFLQYYSFLCSKV